MMTSKARAALRAKANELDTTLMVGKEGVTETVIAEAERQLDARELIKGKVLETALLSSEEVRDALCSATGADGIQCVGSKFVIYRKSEKPALKKAAEEKKKKKINPVRAGAQKRRAARKQEQERKNNFFKQAAIDAAIERRRAEKIDEE